MLLMLLFIYSAVFTSFLLFAGEHFFEWRTHLFRWSACDHCGQRLYWWHLLPIVSYLFQKGKSVCCQNKLKSHYLWLELLAPIYTVLLYLKYDFSHSFVFLLLLFYFLLLFTVTDYLYLHIPLNVLYVLFGLVWAVQFKNPFFYHSLGICLFVFGLLFLFFRKGIGSGDIQLLIVYGAALGWEKVYWLFSGAVLTSLFFLAVLVQRNKLAIRSKVPFVPFLFLNFIGITLI